MEEKLKKIETKDIRKSKLKEKGYAKNPQKKRLT